MEENRIPTLTEEQKQAILNRWNDKEQTPPSLKELVVLCFGGAFDGRSLQARAVKEFLATRSIKVKASYEYVPKGLIELNEEQQLYVVNNVKTMSCLEMAKVLFNRQDLTNLSQEVRSLSEFVKSLPKQVTLYEDPEQVTTEDYVPVKVLSRALARINRYVHNKVDPEKPTPAQKKNSTALIGYLNTYRFMSQINAYQKVKDRELFESEFIRCTYDKPDLTEEEVDQYIIYSTEVVIGKSILERIETFQTALDDEVAEKGRIQNMAFVEAITSMRTEYNQCVNRQQKLLSDLKIKRSERLSTQIQQTASILNLVELWKSKEERDRIIRYADLRKQKVSEEFDRLDSMDELKCKIAGISKDEVLNG